MTTTTDTKPTDATPERRTNGMTREQWAQSLAFIERIKGNEGYFERWEEQVAEARAQIEEQDRRALDEAEGK